MLDPATAVLDIGSKLIDRLWPNPVDRDAAKLKLLELQQSGDLAKLTAETDLAKGQLAVNAAEAASGSALTSGWRPAVGWVCAGGLAYQVILSPLLTWGAALAGHPIATPELNMETLMTLLFGMLGLGGYRTFEKTKGVAS
jgi:hypothetical protein